MAQSLPSPSDSCKGARLYIGHALASKSARQGFLFLPARLRVVIIRVLLAFCTAGLVIFLLLSSFRVVPVHSPTEQHEVHLSAAPSSNFIPADEGDAIVTSALGKEYESFWRYKDRTEHETSLPLRNLCFSLDKQQFTVARADIDLLTQDVQAFRSSSSFTYPFLLRVDDPIRRSQVREWIPGHTVVSLSMSLANSTNAHFYFWAEPMFAAMSILLKHLKVNPAEVHIAYKTYPPPETMREPERSVWELMFGQVPRANHHSLDSIKSEGDRKFVCLEKALVIENAYSSTLRAPADTAHLRENMRRTTGLPVVDDCAESGAIRDKVFVLSRRAYSRRFANEEEMVAAIRDVFGSKIDVVLFESPNQRCVPGWEEKDDLSFCRYVPEKLLHLPLKEHIFFNKITFLISVHGAGNMNYLYLPKGAHAIEIMPVGAEYGMYGQLAGRIGMDYFEFIEPNRTLYEKEGLGAIDPLACPGDNECRRKAKILPVQVTLDGKHGLKRLLETSRGSWIARCGGVSK